MLALQSTFVNMIAVCHLSGKVNITLGAYNTAALTKHGGSMATSHFYLLSQKVFQPWIIFVCECFNVGHRTCSCSVDSVALVWSFIVSLVCGNMHAM